MASTGSPRNKRKTISFFRVADHRLNFGGRAGAASSRYALLAQRRRHSNSFQHVQLRFQTHVLPQIVFRKIWRRFKKDGFICCPEVLHAISHQLIMIHVKSQPTKAVRFDADMYHPSRLDRAGAHCFLVAPAPVPEAFKGLPMSS
jgi:hypothetical protein